MNTYFPRCHVEYLLSKLRGEYLRTKLPVQYFLPNLPCMPYIT